MLGSFQLNFILTFYEDRCQDRLDDKNKHWASASSKSQGNKSFTQFSLFCVLVMNS